MAQLGIQLYTVRDMLQKDYLGTIKKMKDIGYDGVEFYGDTMDRMSGAELKSKVNGFGLEIAGITFNHDIYEDRLDEIISFCLECGCQDVSYPGVFDEKYMSETGFQGIAQTMNGWGKKLKENGIQFSYHIHGHEFDIYNGKTGMDIFIDNINTEYVNLEIDVYWVASSGTDSVKFVEKYGVISPFIHFKDCIDTTDMIDTEVGNGCIDMLSIAKIGLKNNARWFIVEQEQFDKPSLEAAQINSENLKAIVKKAMS